MGNFVPKGFVARTEAAKEIGIDYRCSYFIALWEKIILRSGVVFDSQNVNGQSITITNHGADFLISQDVIIPRVFDPNGTGKPDMFIRKSAIPDLGELYFAYCPYTSLAPTKSTNATKAQKVKVEGKGKSVRAHFFCPVPKKTDDFISVAEIARFFNVSESGMSIRVSGIKQQYEDYWLRENRFQSGSKDYPAKPIAIIEGKFEGRGALKDEKIPYKLKVIEDISIMRQISNQGKIEKPLCIRKSKLAELFPDLYLMKLLRKKGVEIEKGEGIYSPKAFAIKFVDGTGRQTIEQIAIAAKRQYDKLVLGGKSPDDQDWKDQLIWIEEMAFPASVFCYGKINKMTLFCIRDEANAWFGKLPEFQVRNPQTTIEWFNKSRAVSFFNARLEKIDDSLRLSEVSKRLVSFFDDAYASKGSWIIEARKNFFSQAENSTPASIKLDGREVSSESLSITMLKGGQPTCFIKHKAMLETVDAIFFLPEQLKKKSPAVIRKTEHWLCCAINLQNSVEPQYKALVGNLAIIVIAQMVDAIHTGIFLQKTDEKQTAYLDEDAKQQVIDKVLAIANELYGYEIGFQQKRDVPAR